MSMMVSFVLSFFPRDVLDEILNLIESVSEDFPSYSFKHDSIKPSDSQNACFLVVTDRVIWDKYVNCFYIALSVLSVL